MDERSCPHCARQIRETGAIFCPHCEKALVEFAPAAPVPIEVSLLLVSTRVPEQDRSQARVVTAFTAGLFLLMILVTDQSPRVQQIMVKMFDPAPFGLTPQVFGTSLTLVLCFPLAWPMYHYCLIMMQARRDGLPILGLAGLFNVLGLDRYYPHLRRSKWICIGGLLYFVLIAVAWVVHAPRLRV